MSTNISINKETKLLTNQVNYFLIHKRKEYVSEQHTNDVYVELFKFYQNDMLNNKYIQICERVKGLKKEKFYNFPYKNNQYMIIVYLVNGGLLQGKFFIYKINYITKIKIDLNYLGLILKEPYKSSITEYTTKIENFILNYQIN